jgi:hypothetical protein
MRILEVNPNEIKIKFYDKQGNIIEDSDYSCEFFGDLFSVECEGVNPSKVLKVEYPVLDYKKNDIVKVKIYMEE